MAIKSAVTEAVQADVGPLHECFKQDQIIKDLKSENANLEEHYDKSIKGVENRYEKFRNIANAHAKILSDNARMKEEIVMLNAKIEEVPQRPYDKRRYAEHRQSNC